MFFGQKVLSKTCFSKNERKVHICSIQTAQVVFQTNQSCYEFYITMKCNVSCTRHSSEISAPKRKLFHYLSICHFPVEEQMNSFSINAVLHWRFFLSFVSTPLLRCLLWESVFNSCCLFLSVAPFCCCVHKIAFALCSKSRPLFRMTVLM